jgi:hypothetical protein
MSMQADSSAFCQLSDRIRNHASTTQRGIMATPPLVGLSHGLCGSVWRVAYFTHRTVNPRVQELLSAVDENNHRASYVPCKRYLLGYAPVSRAVSR